MVGLEYWLGCSALTIQVLSQTLLTGLKNISPAEAIEIHSVEHTVHIVFFIIPNECIYCTLCSQLKHPCATSEIAAC